MANFKHAVCTVKGCERPHKARGFCNPHYMEAKRNNEFKPKPWAKPMEERKRPNWNALPDDDVEELPVVDPDGFWEFVKKELQL